jgi:hypothetical protein
MALAKKNPLSALTEGDNLRSERTILNKHQSINSSSELLQQVQLSTRISTQFRHVTVIAPTYTTHSSVPAINVWQNMASIRCGEL